MITVFLVVALIAPDGSWSQSVQAAASRKECRAMAADVYAAMRTKSNGYKLVSVDCEAAK